MRRKTCAWSATAIRAGGATACRSWCIGDTPISAISSPRASRSSTFAIPRSPSTVKYVPAPPNTWSLHLQAFGDLLLVVHNKDMFAQPELADEKAYYKGSVDHHAKPEAAAAQLVGGHGRLRHFQARRSQADRLHAGRGHGAASPLVCRRRVRLRLGAARRLLRLHPHHHRRDGPEEADNGRQILAAGDERRRRREGELADQERPLRAASRHCPRRYRLLQLARRLPRGSRRQEQGRAQAASSTKSGRRRSAGARTTRCRSPTAIC